MKFSLTVRRPVLFAVLTAAAGLTLSFYAHTRIARTEADTAWLTADSLRLSTGQELKLFSDVLESVCALHALSDAVDQAAMDEFIEKGMVHQRAVLGPFGLVQQISPLLRAAIESKEETGPGAYKVVQKGPDGDWIPAAGRPVYYPLTWQSRPDGLQVPIGFDFGSTDELRDVINHIGRTHQTTLAPSPLDAPTPDTSPSYWVLAPIIPRNSSFILGFAVAVLHPDTILNTVAAHSAHSPRLSLKPADEPVKPDTRLNQQHWVIRQPLEAVGTTWVFECSLPAPATERRSTAVLIFGLTVTALMTGLFLMLASRTRRIEAEVLARTEELRVANQRLEQNIQERAQMEKEMQELSAREQRRIGRDLHDSLGQKLTGAVFLSRSLLNWLEKHGGREAEVRDQASEVATRHPPLDTSEQPLATCPSPLATQTTHARTLNETLKDAVAQVRNMARGLASVTLNEESLEESLEQLAEEMSSLYHTACSAERAGTLPDLDRKTKEQLYFIAREAVNNAARHGNPTRITIQLFGNESEWTLRVEDDGSGLPGGSQALRPDAEGMGLRIMRHRAGLIGAQLAINSTSGKGTVITVTGTV